MARARNIKPSIMDNEELAELEPLTRLLFIYLWMLADREGRLEDRPKRIAAQALAYDRSADVEVMLSELASEGFIHRYQFNGVKFIQITNFTKHQSPHGTEKDSDIPDENGVFTVYERTPKGYATKAHQESNCDLTVKQQNDNALIPDSLIPDSLIPDSSPVGDSAPAPRKARASRKCPADFTVTESMETWAASEAPGVDVRRETDKFRDHTFKTAYTDWPATWRNWMRNAFDRLPRAANARASPTAQSFASQDREAGMQRWEQMTGRVHPDRQASKVIDITPKPLRLEAS